MHRRTVDRLSIVSVYDFIINEKRVHFSLFRLHVYRDRVGGEGGFLENTIRISLPKGLPLGFGEICVDFWDFRRGVPEPLFLLLLPPCVARILVVARSCC